MPALIPLLIPIEFSNVIIIEDNVEVIVVDDDNFIDVPIKMDDDVETILYVDNV